ncbi:MAG: hypothetical protein PHF17_03715 [Arcobacteraceae bacterium]|jgi:hypothetical protein|nr:hypothetical protein [Arcobacteraceae bacterium]
MQIEFKKVPSLEKEFSIKLNSVEFSGTFCKISQNLVKLKSKIVGKLLVDCCKCGEEHYIEVDEIQDFILSDGEFSSSNEREGEIVIEIENHVVDFDEILSSELESISSDYHICPDCQKNGNLVDIEY